MFARASGLLRSAFVIALNFFLGCTLGVAFGALVLGVLAAGPLVSFDRTGKGRRNIVTLGSFRNLFTC